MADLSAYADALGLKPKMPANPPAGSGIVTAEQQRPDTHDGSPADIAELRQAIASAPDAASKQTLSALLQQKTGRADQSARLSPYAQALGINAPAATPQTPVQAPQIVRPQETPPPGYEAGGTPNPSNPNGWRPIQGPAETVGDKLIGAGEAGLNAVTGATTGTVGGLLNAGNALVRKAGYALGGVPETPDLQGNDFMQRAFDAGSQAGTYQPRTEAGQRYTETVVAPIGQTLMAAAPVLHTATGGVPMAKQAIGDKLGAAMAERSPAAAKAAFDASKRIDPTLEQPKPTPQQIELALAQQEPVPTRGGAQVQRVIQEQPRTAAIAQEAPPQSLGFHLNLDEPPTVAPPPTLAQASPLVQQAAAKAKAAGKLNEEVLARHVAADTLPVPIKLTEGQATLDPVLISNEMNGRGRGSAASVSPEFYKQQGQAVAQNMEAIRASAAPDVPSTASHIDHGQTLIDAYKQADAPVRDEISANYKALADANGGEMPLSGQAFVSSAEAALKKANRTRFLPAEVRGIMDDIRETGKMSFDEFEAYRTILAEQARKAERAGDGTAAYAVGVVREALESIPMDDVAAGQKALADTARRSARARFEAMAADPAYKAAISDATPIGEPSALADKFFGSYVINGKRANLARMRSTLEANPLAAQTIAAGTLDLLARQLKADPATGNFSQAGYNKGLAAINPKIDALLDGRAAQQVQALGSVAKIVQTQPRGSYVNNSNTATALMSEGAKNTAEHGTNMLFGGIPVGTVVRKAGGIAADAIGTNRAAKKATAPGAGMTKSKGSDFPGVETE